MRFSFATTCSLVGLTNSLWNADCTWPSWVKFISLFLPLHFTKLIVWLASFSHPNDSNPLKKRPWCSVKVSLNRLTEGAHTYVARCGELVDWGLYVQLGSLWLMTTDRRGFLLLFFLSSFILGAAVWVQLTFPRGVVWLECSSSTFKPFGWGTSSPSRWHFTITFAFDFRPCSRQGPKYGNNLLNATFPDNFRFWLLGAFHIYCIYSYTYIPDATFFFVFIMMYLKADWLFGSFSWLSVSSLAFCCYHPKLICQKIKRQQMGNITFTVSAAVWHCAA